ncbi:MAG: aspartate aminotransferase family protein [Proteobacteria bacterium]|nr:aspartate aminotransferase family protein [Pseudomonadota bacterium]
MNKINPILNAYFRLPIKIIKGDGVYLYDDQEKRYLDFASGIAVTNIGHNNQHINEALINQASQLWHCSNLFTIPKQQELAERLVKLSFADKVFFCSSGLEAVECAIKMMRKYHYEKGDKERYHIITLEGGFHGRSLATLSAGGNEYARRGFGPLLEGFKQVKRNDIAALKAAITDQTAGIMLETIQSEGGVHVIDKQYLQEVRQLTAQKDIILCFDEVQTGYGRTGELFSYQSLGIEPDIMTLAKGIGNGFPLAACLSKANIANAITPGSHGSTYGGNPLAMAVGNAVLDIVTQKPFLNKVNELSQYLNQSLQKLAQEFPNIITEVRGIGLIYGIEVKISATEVLKTLIDNGLIVTKVAGDKVLRLLPPLIIEKTHIDQMCEIMRKSLASL